MDNEQRQSDAQWALERQLFWIAAADSKVGFVVALQTAMIGGLATAISTASSKSPYTFFFVYIYLALALATLFYASRAVSPRVDGPDSLIFFKTVAKLEVYPYVEKFMATSEEQLLRDLLSQVHRNAQIAEIKYRWVKKAMTLAMWAGVPWVIAVILVVMP
jgi:hypothetical protein